jgi:hypothetical protein
MHRYVRCALFLGALAVAQAPAWAQSRGPSRQGLWGSVGFGTGSRSASADGMVSSGRSGSVTGQFRLGGTIGERTLIGGEIDVWTKSESGLTATVGNVSAALYFYPMPDAGLFVKGGVGMGIASAGTNDNTVTVRGNGAGLIAGVGYDYRIGRNISLTPTATLFMGWPGPLKYEGEDVFTGYKYNVLDLGVAITFH